MAEDIETAVARALEDSPDRNFTETVDLAINLRDLDLNEPSNRVDESIVLPSGTGQETRIVVIAEGETAVRAEAADDVLSVDDVADLEDDDAKDMADETDFFIAEEAMMQDIARYLGTILGPREDAGPARARRRRRRDRQPAQEHRADPIG